jgi:predicted GNAT family acetyltransferase
MAVHVRKQTDRSRYEISVGDELVGRADYVERGEQVVLPHTEIDARFQDQGLAGILVAAVLDDVRASGRRVVPECSYVAAFIRQHPDYADLVASWTSG